MNRALVSLFTCCVNNVDTATSVQRTSIPTTTHIPLINENAGLVETVDFINNAITLKNCKLECKAEKNDEVFTSNWINFKNCTILCYPDSAQQLKQQPEPNFSFTAINVSDHFNNVQGSNLNFSYSPNERKKPNSVVVDDETYVPSLRGDN